MAMGGGAPVRYHENLLAGHNESLHRGADERCGVGDRASKQKASLEAEGAMTTGHWAISECHQTVSIFFLLQVSF